MSREHEYSKKSAQPASRQGSRSSAARMQTERSLKARRLARKRAKQRARRRRMIITTVIFLALTLSGAALLLHLLSSGTDNTAVYFQPAQPSPAAETAAAAGISTPVPTPTPEPTPEPTPVPTPTPTPEPTVFAVAPKIAPMGTAPVPELRGMLKMGEIVEDALPSAKKYGYRGTIIADGEKVSEYSRETPIAMPDASAYAQVDGVLTFRGNNYRDGAAFGVVPDNPSGFEIVWEKNIGAIENWGGVGWTGQASIVRWPESTRRLMNINAEKKEKDGLCEVIYGTLDGNIYFLDLEDGKATRDPIKVPSSIKGSVSVDPRGYPLLYCGQGIPEVKGQSVKIGTRIFSLIDQECLYFLNGRDSFCLRGWYAFDCAPLVDAASDTLIQLGENGIVYTLDLNTEFDEKSGDLSIDPVIDRLVYTSGVTSRMGMENSPSVYDHYAYFTDNSGLLTCLDLNTMRAVWLGDVGDDSDSSLVLEDDGDNVWLYTVCELDLNGISGNVYCRKYNALTGEEMWKVPVECHRGSKDVDAGGFATPAVGKGSLRDLVFFNVCRTKNGSGLLLAIDKKSGETVWSQNTGAYSWSSPVCTYDSRGRGYIIYGNSVGTLRLCDGLTGEQIADISLGTNIEGSPAIFGDMLVVGTRGSKIFGVKITN